ncbi:MAG TPA: BamA/TamA family outer membrane protein [Steroidobacteraceae bacterium]|nr:BamA/TamA family outer membrane protein [Steroidobacteraceae bacterium]
MGQCNSPHGARPQWRASGVLVLLLGCVCAGPQARAGVTITVTGVSDPLRSNVLTYLSFSRYQRSKQLTPDTVDRLESRIGREVHSALRPFGYFQPTVHESVKASGPGNWQVTIAIDPGQPVILQSMTVQVIGPGARSRRFKRITSNMPLHVGSRLDEAAYDEVKGDLLRTAATYGYVDAKLTHHELLINPAAHTASIALELQTGVRYRFGDTTIQQHAVSEKLVRRYLRYRKGDPFDLTDVLRTQFALDDSEYFSNLEVLSGTPNRGDHTVPVSIQADPNRPNVYSIAGGYETDTGARGILSWQDRRVNSYGHKMSVDLEAAQVTKYSLQSRYIIPIGDPAVENLTLSGIVQQQQLADVDARTMSLGPSVTRVTGRWQTVWFVNGVHATGTVQGTPECLTGNKSTPYAQCEDATGALVPSITAGMATNDLLVPGVDIASVPKGYLGEPMFAHGFFAEIRGSEGAFGSKANFLQLHIQLERVMNLAPKWHLLLRDEFGATVASHFDEMPSAMRFFAGGEGSVRGFSYNDLSPLQNVCEDVVSKGIPAREECVLNQKAGGKHLITGSVEFDRDLPRNFGVAVFFDYGNAFNHFGRQDQTINTTQGPIEVKEPLLQYGAGIGFRVRLPVLTLGIDIGQPLSQSGSPRLYINFSPKL